MQQLIENLIEKGYKSGIYNGVEVLPFGIGSSKLKEKDFSIDEIYVFNQHKDNDQEMIVVAVSSQFYNSKFILINSLSFWDTPKRSSIKTG